MVIAKDWFEARGMVTSEAAGRTEALRRIEACRSIQAEELDLGGLQLTALDGELLAALCRLRWLRRLFLGLSAEAREDSRLAFIDGERNSKVCNALGALPGALFDALTRIEQLDLALNQVHGLPVSIANLTALTSLNLAANRIGAEGVQALEGLVNLTTLNLAGNGIGDEGAQAAKGLAKLAILDLSYNNIGAEGVQALKNLVDLAGLNLALNHIGPAAAQALKGLVKLTYLDLSDNEIGPEGAYALKGLVNLAGLKLARNHIGSEGAQALKGLVNLTYLACPATKSGPKGRTNRNPVQRQRGQLPGPAASTSWGSYRRRPSRGRCEAHDPGQRAGRQDANLSATARRELR
jgi:Ran GTPase-activating protein (RanGAP) involved in mRNA processing and transport